MRTANVIVAHPASNDKLEALKAFLQALKIDFEVTTPEQSPYNPEFVKLILQGDEDIKAGKGKKVTLEELDNLWK
jgi:hypothetical protein